MDHSLQDEMCFSCNAAHWNGLKLSNYPVIQLLSSIVKFLYLDHVFFICLKLWRSSFKVQNKVQKTVTLKFGFCNVYKLVKFGLINICLKTKQTKKCTHYEQPTKSFWACAHAQLREWASVEGVHARGPKTQLDYCLSLAAYAPIH